MYSRHCTIKQVQEKVSQMHLNKVVECLQLLGGWLGSNHETRLQAGSSADAVDQCTPQLLKALGVQSTSHVSQCVEAALKITPMACKALQRPLLLLQCIPPGAAPDQALQRQVLSQLCLLRAQAHAYVPPHDIGEDHGRAAAGAWAAAAILLDATSVEAVHLLAEQWLLTTEQEHALSCVVAASTAADSVPGAVAAAHASSRLAKYSPHKTAASCVQQLADMHSALLSDAGVLAWQAEVAFYQGDSAAAVALMRGSLSQSPHSTLGMPVYFAALVNLCAGVPAAGLLGIGPSAANSAVARQAGSVTPSSASSDPMLRLLGAGTSKSSNTQAAAARAELLRATTALHSTRGVHAGGALGAVAQFGAACLAMAQGNVLAAETALKASLAADATCAPAWLALGHVSAAQEMTDAALSAYRTAQRLFPGWHAPVLACAQELARSHNVALADGLLQHARALCPADPMAYHEAGVLAFNGGDFSAAAQCFQFVLNMTAALPSHLGRPWVTAHANAAHAFRKLGVQQLQAEVAHDTALAEGRAAWQAAHTSSNAGDVAAPSTDDVIELGRLTVQGRQAGACFDRALALYDGALLLDARDADCHLGKGITHSLLGQALPAITAFHTALARAPESTYAAQLLREALVAAFDSGALLDEGAAATTAPHEHVSSMPPAGNLDGTQPLAAQVADADTTDVQLPPALLSPPLSTRNTRSRRHLFFGGGGDALAAALSSPPAAATRGGGGHSPAGSPIGTARSMASSFKLSTLGGGGAGSSSGEGGGSPFALRTRMSLGGLSAASGGSASTAEGGYRRAQMARGRSQHSPVPAPRGLAADLTGISGVGMSHEGTLQATWTESPAGAPGHSTPPTAVHTPSILRRGVADTPFSPTLSHVQEGDVSEAVMQILSSPAARSGVPGSATVGTPAAAAAPAAPSGIASRNKRNRVSFGSVASVPRSLLSPVAALSPPPRPAGGGGFDSFLPSGGGGATPAPRRGRSRQSLGFGASRIHASGGSDGAALNVSGVSDFSLTMADSRDIAAEQGGQGAAATPIADSSSEMAQSDSE